MMFLHLLWACQPTEPTKDIGADTAAGTLSPPDTDSAAQDTDSPPLSTSDTGTVADTGGTTAPCPSVDLQTRAAIVTDIDETLTTSDGEWLTQIINPFHDPDMRPDANTLMRGYLEKGYRVFYLTARGEGLFLLNGTSAREATESWLSDHDFPYTSDGVFLADGIGALGGEAADYKTEILQGLLEQGFDLVYAYGNSGTDIEAYQNVGIDPTRTFLVGSLAGQLGVEGLTDEEAYTAHLPYLDSVPCGY